MTDDIINIPNNAVRADEAHLDPKTIQSRRFNYAISKDISADSGAKKAVIWNDDIDVITDFIKKITKDDNHYYETINVVMRRLYLDIDFAKVATADRYAYFVYTDANLINFVNGITKPLFDEMESRDKDVDVSKINVIIHYCVGDIDGVSHITSIHIILSNIRMDYRNMKAFIGYCSTKYELKLDMSSYSASKQFRLPNNTKKGQDRPLLEVEVNDPSAYLIANTYGKDNIEFIFVADTTDEVEDTTLSLVDERAIILFGDIQDGFAEVVQKDAISSKFWTSKDWTYITIMMYRLDIYNMDTWAKMSADRAPQYTYEDNIKYINRTDKNGPSYGKVEFVKVINKYIDGYKLEYNSVLSIFGVDFKDFISNNFNEVDADEVIECYKTLIINTDDKKQFKAKLVANDLTFNLNGGAMSYKDGRLV